MVTALPGAGGAAAPFELTICGLDELDEHGGRAVTHVLSILDPGHPEPQAFAAYGAHARLALRFHDVIDPTPGFAEPREEHVAALLAFGRHLDEPGGHLLVHCHAGISRSTAAATLLLAQAEPARPAADIVARIVSLRDKAWPNLRMIELGDALLGRRGRLVEAVRGRHRAVAAARPEIARMMVEAGRGREVGPR